MPRKLGLKTRLLFASITLLAFYIALETLATAGAWVARWDTSYWLFEDSGRTWQFDAARGYRLTATPSRFLRATDGRFEYVGLARGNAQGFADRDDFTTRRTAPGIRRFAVFGDSFTAEEHLGQSWPGFCAPRTPSARAEASRSKLLELRDQRRARASELRARGPHEVVAADGYELDGIVFAVFGGDLRRKFTVWDHRLGDHPHFGRSPRWDPATWPTTLDEARSFLAPHPGHVLSREEFERALQGHWPRPVPRRLRPFLLTRAWHALRPGSAEGEPEGSADDDPARDRLIVDVARFLADRKLPALVIHIPDRSSLLDPARAPSWPRQEAEEFARAIGAEFLDGTPAFAGLRPSEVRAPFRPRDGPLEPGRLGPVRGVRPGPPPAGPRRPGGPVGEDRRGRARSGRRRGPRLEGGVHAPEVVEGPCGRTAVGSRRPRSARGRGRRARRPR